MIKIFMSKAHKALESYLYAIDVQRQQYWQKKERGSCLRRLLMERKLQLPKILCHRSEGPNIGPVSNPCSI